MAHETKEIQLTQGHVALVDARDYEKLSRHKWCYSTGYAVRMVYGGGKQWRVSMHREIIGANPGQLVDHIDRNPLNNCRDNLRLVSRRQNALNTGAKGVCFDKASGLWIAYIMGSKYSKRVHLGCFETEIAALEARKRAVAMEFAA